MVRPSQQHLKPRSTVTCCHLMRAKLPGLILLGTCPWPVLPAVSCSVWECQQIRRASQGGSLTVIVMVPVGLDPSEG